MFARLLQWFHTKPASPATAAPAAPAAPAAQAVVRASSGLVALAPPPSNELFLDQLAREMPPVEPLSEAEEAQVSTLVLQVVEQVSRRKIEPPVMPALVPRVLALVGEPEVDITRLTRLIEQDLAISAKLLSVANSAAFGASREIATVRDAIRHLGTEQVAQVAIGLACRSNFEQAASEQAIALRARWSRLFQHGMTCAFAAAHLAGQRCPEDQELAFLGGLFHDVGKAVALRAVEALAKSGQLGEVSDLAIDEALHRVHAYPGDEFYEKWTLPEALMSICAQHHQLEDLEEDSAAHHFVALTSGFDALLAGGPAERRTALSEIRTSADRLALSEVDLRALYTQTHAFGERAKRMFLG